MAVFFKKHAIIIIAILFFFGRYFIAAQTIRETPLKKYIGQAIIVRGVVISSAETPLLEHALHLRSIALYDGHTWHSVYGTIIVRVRDLREFSVSDSLTIKGMLKPAPIRDPRLSGIVSKPEILHIQHASYSLLRMLTNIRRLINTRLEQLLPEPAGSLSAGILLGNRTAISQEIKKDFQNTGMTHVLALSGFNILILINCIASLPLPIGRRWSLLTTICIIVAFVAMVGFSASVVRAAIMGCLSLFARIWGRKAISLRSLALAAFTMAFLDPFIVVYDIGFQLSCAATAGIILYARKIATAFCSRVKYGNSRAVHIISELFATTSAAYIFTMPLTIYYFGGFSLVGLAANMLLASFIPLIMLFAFLTLLFGTPIAAPTWLICRAFIAAIHFFASLSFAFIEIGIS